MREREGGKERGREGRVERGQERGTDTCPVFINMEEYVLEVIPHSSYCI